MKRLLCIAVAIFLLFSLAACGSHPTLQNPQGNDGPSAPASSTVSVSVPTAAGRSKAPDSNSEIFSDNSTRELDAPDETGKAGSAPEKGVPKTLIAYFSRVGNTDFPKGIDAVASASLIVKDGQMVGNTQYLANLIQQGTGGDLFLIQTAEKYPADYDAVDRQGGIESRERPRPALAAHVENISNYDVVFIGFPIWYSDMPMAVYTFLEEYDLSGKTVVPFGVSGGSGFSHSISAIQALQPNATVLTDGFTATHSGIESVTFENVRNWLAELGMTS